MDYSKMSIDRLKKNLALHQEELKNAQGDSSLDRQERQELIADIRSCIGDIKEELEFRREQEELEDSYLN